MAYLSRKNLFALLDGLKTEYEVFVPFKKGPFRFYQPYVAPDKDIVIGEVRATEPLKGFYTPVKEKVAELFNPEPLRKKDKPRAIIGVKACDLHGFIVQDHVFCQGCQDPFYASAREETLIISADCTQVIDTCFCLALGVNPFPESLFDMNMSEVTEGYIIEVGSPKGQRVFDTYKSLFQKSPPPLLTEKEQGRTQIADRVRQNIAKHGVPSHDQLQGVIPRNYESPIWEDEVRTCTECGACTTICPTCHCFMLTDEQEEDKFIRYRQWDSCMLKDYARVAGGGNPRPKLGMRLRNRFEKKFEFFPQVAGLQACTGCGRCISACPANIDIRNILKKLVHNG